MSRRICGCLAVCLAWILANPAGVESQAGCRSATSVASQLIDGSAAWDGLPITARYGLDEQVLVDEGRLRATVEIRLEQTALRTLQDLRARTLCISLVLDAEGELPVAHHRRLDLEDLRAAGAWSYGFTVDLPEAAEQLLLILEEPAAGLWGAAIADDAGELPRPGPAAVRLAGSGEAWLELGRPPGAAAAATDQEPPTVIRLVPPRKQPVTGGTRFDALVSTTAIEQVVFELDGNVVATRKRSKLLDRPFAARIELASPARPQTLRVIAYDASGRELGRDTLVVNENDAPLRVRISGLEGDPASGSVEVAADVSLPAGSQLDRIEVYRNQTLLARLDKGPIRYRVPTPEVRPDDYIRVAVFLKDGRSIDDVVLLASPGDVERVEVNLVELHVIVTDRQGRTVDDLKQDDFTIIHQGKPQPAQNFAYADDVTLLLGLVIDTSGSMRLLMEDTRKAAVKFLGTTVLPQDRAFLVGFARQPELRHPTTSDLPRLLLGLAQLNAVGQTAMYDAIVFSMAQFERQSGRKALVVLTDGDDLDSRFGPRYCIDLAHKAGVPIYIIGLGALDQYERHFSKKDLRRTTSETGGRLYFVESFEELDQAYAQINAELRSQYSLSFYADSDLDPAELRKVEVRLARPDLSARTIVGSSPPAP